VKKKIFLLFILFLNSCAPAAAPAAAEALPSVTAAPQATVLPPSAVPSAVVPSPTATAEGCNPFAADFCITDGHFIFQIPIQPPGNTVVDVSYRYGSTQDGRREPHHGVEFLNKFGTPIHAAGDGVVQFAGPDKEALYSPWKNFYGNVVVIRHANEMYTLYGHLSKINVQAGDEVRAGDVIGEVGQSGVATGSHLHFEVRRGGDGTDYFSTQNPELWLVPNRNEDGMLLGAISFSVLNENLEFIFADFTARYHLDKNAPKVKSYYGATYATDMMLGEENAALGGLPPGFYRVALTFNGQIYERWVEVQSGKLTQVVFVVK
jgi:murein DD-endopeptidase MepM/ murein hydrolase activator NlpD